VRQSPGATDGSVGPVAPGLEVPARLNLPAIERTLRRVQERFGAINDQSSARRDPMDDRVVENMLAGYAFVDAAVTGGLQLFALGNLKHLLELNTLVLCGTSEARRQAHAGHLRATERRFYGEHAAGIQDLVEWSAAHDQGSVWRRAAGTYVRLLSKPQLFIEGNHRTGALVMSYVLMREGQPPFVLSEANATEYFDPSTRIRDTDKRSLRGVVRLTLSSRRLARLLREHTDPGYLLA